MLVNGTMTVGDTLKKMESELVQSYGRGWQRGPVLGESMLHVLLTCADEFTVWTRDGVAYEATLRVYFAHL